MTRHIFRISLVMLLGVVTSVAVAVAISLRPILSQTYGHHDLVETIDHDSGCIWCVNIRRGVGVTMFYSQRVLYDADRDSLDHSVAVSYGDLHAQVPAGLPLKRARAVFRDELSRAGQMIEVPFRSYDPRAPGVFESEYHPGEVSSCHMTGWPFRCMWRELFYEVATHTRPPPLSAEDFGFKFDVVRWRSESDVVLYPIWHGLLANTAIYGGVWWAMLFGPGMFIRWRRRRAGRCAKCGYDLRGLSPAPGSACPECGAHS